MTAMAATLATSIAAIAAVALDQLETFGVVNGSDGVCWNPSFGSHKPAGRHCAL